MSLKSWKQEFYPVSAQRTSKGKAVAHSLRKWEGLLKKNLKRHGISIVPGGISETHEVAIFPYTDFHFDTDTCALCRHFFDPREKCADCPIVKETGQMCVDEGGAYNSFNCQQDPIPMIRLLRKIRKKELAASRNHV